MSNTSYRKAKFIVETNARGQARYDAYDLPLLDAMKYVNDPRVVADSMEVLKSVWARQGNTNVVFKQLDKSDYETLTELQRADLVIYWCSLYPVLVIEYLRERLEVNNDIKTHKNSLS